MAHAFFKHVGMANSKKVIIVQRQIPGEEHMAAVLYSDILPSRYHDDIMSVLESDEGQASWEFKDILQRRMLTNGENMLQALSQENYIKRVAQANVLVKPNSKSSIRLDELTKLLNEAGRGEAAVRKLDDMDRQLGMSDEPAMTNAARNQQKHSIELNEGPGVQYDMAPPPVVAPQPDMTAFMTQMMQTMQAMQTQIVEMKAKLPKPRVRKKPVT